ncbi:neural cell adhesion molecule L1 isoform X2 [Magallana gigas]|uniref:neural cell adhesion molecule L1 isoform X2 n=1 Tax=Magallana gigas TaxID=29159 RepID=UPI003341D79D
MDWRLYLVFSLKTFICTVHGQDKSQMPPKMISVFNNEYFFPRDSILVDSSFKCQAENGQIQYVWKKDGVVVENTQFIPVDNSTGILRFVKIQTEHYGTYQCFASNTYGTSLSTPFNLKESMLGRFPIGEPEEVRCKQFGHCKIQCSGKPTCLPDSQCRVEWKIGEGTKTNVEITKRVGVDGNGDLHFLWTDTDLTGLQYKCGMWMEQLKTLMIGSQTSLKIDYSASVEFIEPTIVFKEDGKALIGGKGVLRCMFSGYPVPDIEWMSLGKNTTIKNTTGKYIISDFGRVLTIINAKPDNEGVYSCTGNGTTNSLSRRVFLNVTSAPILPGDNQMRDLVIPVGKDAIFRCEAESLPNELPPTLPIWNKNGVDLVIAGGKYILAENSQVLTVTGVQKSDTGVYQCLSENSEGVLLKEAILKVIDPITVRKRPLDNYKIAPGDILNLAVVADTDPSLTLQYKWMFNDHQGNESEIKSNEYWKLSWPINKQLTIDVSNVTDPTILVSLAGYYSVKIYHNYDEKVINITVETDVFPTADIVSVSPNTNTTNTAQQTNSNAAICIVVAAIFSLFY